MRQQAVLEPGDDDRGNSSPLALCSVISETPRSACQRVEVGDQRDVVEEAR